MQNDSRYYTISPDGIVLSLYIQPRASKNEFCGLIESSLKLRLTSPPVDGAANKICIEFLSKRFRVPKSSIDIISGESSRHKRVKIKSQDIDYLQQIAEELTRKED